ncbi:Heptaprenyl diphosphate synthase component I [uncultured Roseburia sp.]|uniref:Gx transporter family protein n=1 Tax=Brotonthovivens ammoniilytica TaxID=2981725 RepID=A0ABT2TGJ8_9FIRM|nr:Gx transporter family protein [Brotonthovivens ammoniilytica]MCU6761302.1 Gx transporter family protein [Brotonthovivens ammoniilytica]SCI24707.1 Heptaprenyl diphosphate synthase component I [uncultured Roseburia sp.]
MKRNVAFIGVFLALALVCSYVESLIPFYFGIPGMKLGLTNIVIIIMLYCMGTKEAYLISVLRVLLAGFLFGNMFSILYSLAGAMLSLSIMTLLKKSSLCKIITVSTIGGICHNVGQLIVAALVVENYNIFYYLPFLLIAGFITGLVIGIAAQETILRVKRFF